MSQSNVSEKNRIRVTVAAGSTITASQLARDLATDPSLEITAAVGGEILLRDLERDQPRALLLDTRVAGEKTPQLVRDLISRAKLPILIRTEPDEISAAILVDCIEAGAIGVLNKPLTTDQTAAAISSLIGSIKSAAGAVMQNHPLLNNMDWSPVQTEDTASILAIGAGTGGAVALDNLLAQLPENSPGAVVITPLPRQMIECWADRLDCRCRVHVRQARDGDVIEPGNILIAPGNAHTLLRHNGSKWIVMVKDGPAVFHQKPGIEVFFNSIADCAAPQAVCVMLSGTGMDGIAALLKLRKSGSRTLVESPSTSLFAESPAGAIECGAAEQTAPVNQIAQKMLELAMSQPLTQAA